MIRVLALGVAATLAISAPLSLVAAARRPASDTSTASENLPAATSGLMGKYGSAVNMDGIGNTHVGGPSSASSNQMSSYRFRAVSNSLQAVRIQLANALPGYSGGDGGSIELGLRPDDGTPAHLPSGDVLAAVEIRPGVPNAIGTMPLVTFEPPVAMTKGGLYHIVFRNTDALPTVNFSSIDSIVVEGAPRSAPRQPGRSDLDWALYLNRGDGWILRRNYSPIMELRYADGVVDGIGYVYSYVRDEVAIGGHSLVRQRFTVSGPSRVATSVSVRLRRVRGTGSLSVRLETSTGRVIEAGQIASRAVPIADDARWVTLRFTTPRLLARGHGYNLVLRSPKGTEYAIFPIEEGSGHGFSPATYFSDGFAEYSVGSGWRRWDRRTRADLQFYFSE